jgi:hypothetical protein
MKNTYNPPAFSKSAFYHDAGGCDEPQEGMTLRDYFAAKAMEAYIIKYGGSDAEYFSQEAYKISDYMLKERSK